MLAIIATIEIGMTGKHVAPIVQMFTDATFLNLLTLNLLIYDPQFSLHLDYAKERTPFGPN